MLPVITTTVSRASRHPGGGWQRMESTKAVGTACHHYDRGSYIEVLRRLAGGSSWRARVSGYGHHYDSCPGLSVY